MADEPLVVETGVHKPDACVIWLHGLGADGHDFEPIVPELRLDPGLSIRFLFPHAPMMPVTINQGFVMRAWYDIRSADIGQILAPKRMRKAFVPPPNWLPSWSMGRSKTVFRPSASCWRGFPRVGPSSCTQACVTLESSPASWGCRPTCRLRNHSRVKNPKTIPDLGYKSLKRLEQQGYAVEWHEYNGMPHSVSEQEIFHVAEWLEKVLV
jgi:phospholipase/carboxylesterase